MAATTPTTEPASLIAGDTAKWLKTLSNYPASAGWSLAYTLINATGKISLTATAAGDDHLVNVLASTTAGWAPGSYAWRASVSMVDEVYTVASGTLSVQAAFTSATLDTRSQSRMALDAINAYIADPSNMQASSYSISGRTLLRHNLSTIMEMRSKLIVEVAREEAAANVGRGLPGKGRVMVRFGP